MKTKKILRSLMMAACLLAFVHGHAQTSVLGNAPIAPGADYVGWDGNTNVPLMVRHNNNHRIEWYTDSIQRMQLNATTTDSIGYFANQVKDGSLLLCPDVDQFYANGAPGPYSLLHLADGLTNVMTSDRTWMNIGVAFTGNRDMGYIGQMAHGVNRTDMVFHWSDDPGEATTDRARFLYTRGFNALVPTGATSAEGLEGMRLFAVAGVA